MADSKYLDGGGLQRVWDRIKSYLNAWISGWKTTNFGSGTYDNQLGLKISTGDDKNSLVEIKVDDKFAICEFENSTIFDSCKIITPAGIAVLKSKGAIQAYANVENKTAYTIDMNAIQIQSVDGALTANLYREVLSANEEMQITNSYGTLLFWASSQ